MPDWYPETQAALISWHDNFSTQAAINGTTLGLSDKGTIPEVISIQYTVERFLKKVSPVRYF